MYRKRAGALEFLLVHPGGPFFKGKDAGTWTIPKGEIEKEEDGLATARREFEEETGFPAHGQFLELTPIRQKSGKVVRAWAFEGDCNPGTLKSNTFEMQWPPRSGRMQAFPEVDRAAFFGVDAAKDKINPAQLPLLEELARKLLA